MNFNKITAQKKIPEKLVVIRDDSDEIKDKIIESHIDIVSGCNLTCPTCVQGNMDSISGGVMSQDLFKKIITKMKSDFPDLKDIFLYNWTEPFLHNKLPEFIEIVNKSDFRCHLSTNLNHIKNLEDVIKNNPYAIRISLSGFTQEVYKKGHRDGNIETVKQNMKILSNLIKKYHASTKVTVNYIKYKHNLSEIPAMKKFALDLGFDIQTFWAFFMGVETLKMYFWEFKSMAYVIYPDWIDNVLARPLLRTSLGILMPVLTLLSIGFLYFYRKEDYILLSCFTLVLSFYLAHSIFFVLPRYVFTLVPVYIAAIIFMLNKLYVKIYK